MCVCACVCFKTRNLEIVFISIMNIFYLFKLVRMEFGYFFLFFSVKRR